MRKLGSFFCLLLILFLVASTSWSANFLCGDANGDNNLNLSDVIFLANYLLKGGPTPELLASDVDGNQQINLADVIYLANYLFKSGPAPTCPEGAMVKGKVYLNGVSPCCNLYICGYWNCPNEDSSYCSVMNPYAGVKIKAFSQESLVTETFTGQNGNFYLRLSEGTYEIRIYPPQDYIQTFTEVVLVNHQEVDLGETYYVQKFVYQQLMVDFYGDVTPERKYQIVEENGNTVIVCPGSWCVIEVPEQYHPQEMKQILRNNYPDEVEYVGLNIYGCPAQ